MPTAIKKVKLVPIVAQPFLKWAGGKTQLLNELIKRVPKEFGTYYEPFIGGGALYFAIAPKQAVIADINDDLINAYKVVKDHPQKLLEALATYKNDKDYYYNIRSQNQDTLSPIDRAARLIYLNRTCFNGLYRVNKSGQFNVPFANYKNPNFIQTEKILKVSEILKNAEIYNDGFENVLVKAKKGDFVYLDPPYVPKDVFSDFKRYNKEQFHISDHERLADLYGELTDKGCFVMLSNSDTPFTRELFSKWRVDTVHAKRLINKDASKRGKITEIIVTNYDH